MSQKPSPSFLAALGPLLLVLCLLLLAGCAHAPTDSIVQLPPVPVDTVCEQPAELVIPTGTNSEQLEELLYAAYLEVLAKLHACIGL